MYKNNFSNISFKYFHFVCIFGTTFALLLVFKLSHFSLLLNCQNAALLPLKLLFKMSMNIAHGNCQLHCDVNVHMTDQASCNVRDEEH